MTYQKKEVLKEVLGEIQSFLEYLSSLGIDYFPGPLPFMEINEREPILLTEHIEKIKEEMMKCEACPLSRVRRQVIFGEGDPYSRIFVLTEYPKREEDFLGKPITGRAEEMLKKMLFSIKIDLKEVFITPVVKCKTPGSRLPEDEEIQACKKWLFSQIRIGKPGLILALGFTPPKVFFPKGKYTFSELKGKAFKIRNTYIFFTYHPEQIFKNPAVRRTLWEDLQKFKKLWEKIKNEKS